MDSKELERWQKEIGISYITNMESSIVNEILSSPTQVFIAKSARDLQKDLIVLARYRMFIIKEVGTIKSQLDCYSKKLEQRIGLISSKQNAQAKEERRALAIQHDDKAGEYMIKIDDLEIKYNQLRSIPDGIQEFINKLHRLEWEKSEETKAENKIRD